MSWRSDVSQLRKGGGFAGLSSKDLKRIVTAGTHVEQPAQWTLMAQDTGADKAYIILSGTVSIRRGREEIATLGAGDLVGEMGIADKRLRSASVVTTSTVELLHFTREDFQALVDDVPALRALIRERERST